MTEQQRQTGSYRFLNPYNFVRWLGRPKIASSETALLDRCAPPPHDRFLGLTGCITCELTTVTPLFVSDSHDIDTETVDNKEYRTYRFFEYDGKPAIPGSSLRGMVRSMFESITNSCFSVFDGQKRLSYRLEATRAAALVPGRIEEKPGGGWHLRLMHGLSTIVPGQRPKTLYAATVHLYDPIEGDRIKVPKVSLNGHRHGDVCWALVKHKGIFVYVLDINADRSKLRPANRSEQEYIVQGCLCINNQNVENKRKERFFFATKGVPGVPSHLSLDDDVIKKYQDLIADYQERHKEAIQKRRDDPNPLRQAVKKAIPEDKPTDPAFSRYMYSEDDLEVRGGTLVYANLSPTPGGMKVDFMAPAAVPRVAYNHTVGELLDPALRACDNLQTLCPACRTFGWVDAAHEKGRRTIEKEKPVAYAGRVRISYGELQGEARRLPPITLAILGSPKPTTGRFYLRPRSGKPRPGLDDQSTGYDGSNWLRGRKLYRHHGQAHRQEYERAVGGKYTGKDDQNRTVVGALGPGNRFRFRIEFENLAPVELGALLWALELDGKACHRLGYAKPLGFGSVKVDIKDLQVLDPAARYGQLAADDRDGTTAVLLPDDGGWLPTLNRKAEFVEIFQRSMEAAYGLAFVELANVRDILALLGDSPRLPVHYPRTGTRPTPEGKNFEWFVGNKRSGRDAGPRLALPLADEDTEGLPLLDKYGRER